MRVVSLRGETEGEKEIHRPSYYLTLLLYQFAAAFGVGHCVGPSHKMSACAGFGGNFDVGWHRGEER